MSGGRTGRRRRATTTRTWASASTARTATPRRATTRPSRRCATSRASAAIRWCSSARPSSRAAAVRELSRGDRTRQSRKAEPPPDPPYPSLFTRFFRLLSKARPTQRDRRQHAVGNLRPCLGAGGPAERAIAVRDVDAMHRLPQRRRHRPAVRHDRARARQQAGQHLALRHLAHVAEGPCRTRSDLLRAARERDRDLPSGILADDRGHLPRLPCGARPAPVRQRSPRRDRHAASRSRATI